MFFTAAEPPRVAGTLVRTPAEDAPFPEEGLVTALVPELGAAVARAALLPLPTLERELEVTGRVPETAERPALEAELLRLGTAVDRLALGAELRGVLLYEPLERLIELPPL